MDRGQGCCTAVTQDGIEEGRNDRALIQTALQRHWHLCLLCESTEAWWLDPSGASRLAVIVEPFYAIRRGVLRPVHQRPAVDGGSATNPREGKNTLFHVRAPLSQRGGGTSSPDPTDGIFVKTSIFYVGSFATWREDRCRRTLPCALFLPCASGPTVVVPPLLS